MSERDRRENVSEQAAHWLFLSQGPSMSRAERTQFVKWMCESPIHVEEMLRVANLHGALIDFKCWAEIAPGELEAGAISMLPIANRPPKVVALPKNSRISRRLLFPSLAAAAICGVVISLVWSIPRFGRQLFDTDATERREVTLAEGSHIQIAPGTHLRVNLEAKLRRIVLERGRAVFRVAKDAARPFVVEANGTTVRAVGTAFGVEIEPDGVMVTVSHGRVAVSPQGGIPQVNSSSQNLNAATVTAGEQVVVRAGRLSAVRIVDINRALAWADNRIVLQNDTVAEAARLFNNANQVQLRIADEALGARRVSGVFDSSDPLSFVAFLQSDQPWLITESRANELIIRSAPK